LRLTEIAFAAELLREHYDSCSIDLVLPYCDYVRANQPHCLRASAKQLDALPVDRIVLFDLHKDDLLDLLQKPVLHISALSLWAQHIRQLHPSVDLLVSPDIGRRNFVCSLAKSLQADWICLDKRDSSAPLGELPAAAHVFLFDDEIVSGDTIRSAIRSLGLRGIKNISVGITYPLCKRKVLSDLGAEYNLLTLTVGDLIRRTLPERCNRLPLSTALMEKSYANIKI
jgi:phosphoribosylpyrophosphate synthetase